MFTIWGEEEQKEEEEQEEEGEEEEVEEEGRRDVGRRREGREDRRRVSVWTLHSRDDNTAGDQNTVSVFRPEGNIHQSISESVHQSINPSVYQSINQSILRIWLT